MSKVDKPKPLKVYGRSHYACTRCKLSKIKCSGEHPCTNCKNVKKPDDCIYLKRDRKIVIMESDINKLHERVAFLEGQLGKNPADRALGSPKEQFGSVQERSNERTKEFLFNSSGLENFLLSDDANEGFKHKLVDLIIQSLPPKEMAYKCLEAVHSSYASEFYIIDMDTFPMLLEDVYAFYEGVQQRDEGKIRFLHLKLKRHSFCLLFIVLAYGMQILNVPRDNEQIPGVQFYLMASELFNLTHEVVTIEFIMSAALLALYSSNLNRYNTVYNFFGVAIRSAISQGLHRQPSKSDNQDLIQQEKLKRLWWTIFALDATWTAKMNMPAQLDYTETDVDLPTENAFDLNDSFDINILELNVHLVKCTSKSVEKIYGAHLRTFSVNYINTEQFNQKKLIQNVLLCSKELVKDFEVPYLYQFKNMSIIEPEGRRVANLFLRFNLLVAIITKPLISSIFKANQSILIGNIAEVQNTVNKAITCSISNINILLKLYELNRLFTIGFYDSQYLYMSVLILLMSSITDRASVEIVSKAMALLKYMASKGNINAKNCIKKLAQVNEILSKTPEIDFSFNLDLDIQDVVTRRDSNYDVTSEYYNPYEDFSFASLSNFKLYKNQTELQPEQINPVVQQPHIQVLNPTQEFQNQLMHDRLRAVAANYTPDYTAANLEDAFTNNRISNLSGSSQNMLLNMMNSLQSPDNIFNS